ncbi:MAG: hypothetical protein GY771_15830 [bacterium]|nr:hypothetical protein [bacterium]
MIRTASITLAALAILPVALVLLLFGIERLNLSRRNGLWLKLGILINTSVVIALGISGCCGKSGGRVTCYDVAMSDYTEIPDDLEQSSDWSKLESTLMNLEYYIETGEYIDELAADLREKMSDSIVNLKNAGLISEDDASVLSAYCNSRSAYYLHMVGGATCYKPALIPEGKETTKKEIIETTDELRRLYADGKIDTPAYETALANLDDDLKLYTEKEDNAVLRQLLLDLADGQSGTYF